MSGGTPISDQSFHTIQEVAERLNVSPKSVRRWISQGTLKVHRFNKLVRISDTDLAEFIESSRR